MRKIIHAIAVLGTLAWSGAAWAVLQEATVTLTDNGKPLPGATITLTRTETQPPPQQTTEKTTEKTTKKMDSSSEAADEEENRNPDGKIDLTVTTETATEGKTDDSGKIVVVHDEEDAKSDDTVDLTVTTAEGKQLTRRVTLTALLTNDSIDVSLPSEAQQGAGPSQKQTTAECIDLTNLDDRDLQTIVNNPDLRTRMVKLIDEIKQTEETTRTDETKPTEEVQEGKKGKTKKPNSAASSKGNEAASSKSKGKVVRKKEGKHPKRSATQTSGAKPSGGAAEVLGTGLAIGLGVATSRRGHGSTRHGKDMKSSRPAE